MIDDERSSRRSHPDDTPIPGATVETVRSALLTVYASIDDALPADIRAVLDKLNELP